MGIGALMMAQSTAMSYTSAGNAYNAMDSKMALANGNNANMNSLFAQDKDCDSQLLQDSLNYKIADKMQDQAKVAQDRWAQSFNVFG